MPVPATLFILALHRILRACTAGLWLLILSGVLALFQWLPCRLCRHGWSLMCTLHPDHIDAA